MMEQENQEKEKKKSKYLDLPLSVSLKFYKRKDVRDEIVRLAASKEVAIMYGNRGFGKRPDIIQYPNDVLEAAKQGATSFHVSEERWDNTLRLSPTLKKSVLESMRSGWDLVLDIDCKFLEYSMIAADLLIKAIRHHGVKSVSCKFSGNHGFHIGIPFEAFPDNVQGKETKKLFPEGARQIALYLKDMIASHLAKRMLDKDDIDEISKKSGFPFNELVKKSQSGKHEFDPFKVLEIDTILISSRHLYRMPYSFNEKSGLVSIPIDPDKVLEFNKKDAAPDNVKVSPHIFLDASGAQKNEAKKLFIQAFDFHMKEDDDEDSMFSKKMSSDKKKGFEQPEIALDERFFPPCIANIRKGLKDGRKRAVFILLNYLTSIGWDYDKIETFIKDWNKKNAQLADPLRDNFWVGQLRYHKQKKKGVPPPNCNNAMYMKGIGVCFPDQLCAKIKNPAQYSIRKAKYFLKDDAKQKKKDAKNKKTSSAPPKDQKDEKIYSEE